MSKLQTVFAFVLKTGLLVSGGEFHRMRSWIGLNIADGQLPYTAIRTGAFVGSTVALNAEISFGLVTLRANMSLERYRDLGNIDLAKTTRTLTFIMCDDANGGM
jgi:hypothetical protein